MPSLHHLFSRSPTTPAAVAAASESSGMGSIYIAGVVVAAALALGVAAWLTVRFYRIRASARREAQRGTAFLAVKGIVREDSLVDEKDPFATIPTGPAPLVATFSRTNANSSIVFPQKTLCRPGRQHQTRDEIIQYHRQSGNFPSPFTPTVKPPSSTPVPPVPVLVTPPLDTSESVTPRARTRSGPTLTLPEITKSRNSMLSIINAFNPASGTPLRENRFSIMSALSSSSTISINTANKENTTSGTLRKVRQNFDPVLPDELVISQGEQLRVMQSFDDGWCVVGRNSASGSFLGMGAVTSKGPFGGTGKSACTLLSPPSPSTSGSAVVDGNNVELGVVPAWCFLKPVKGLRTERPVRSSSLGVTVNLMDGPGVVSRNDLISWSNF